MSIGKHSTVVTLPGCAWMALGLQADSKINITIVNRGDDVGRHILNARMTIRRIWEAYNGQLGVVRSAHAHLPVCSQGTFGVG